MSAATEREEIVKEPSMLKQKVMIADNYDRLTRAKELGLKVSSTYVPGNLNELVMCFDMLNNLPEINAIQNGMRKKSGGLIMDAEKMGHSEDVCTYVKADIGNMAKGAIAPNGKPMPVPDLLLLSYTGCFTFMKWFELLRDQYGCRTVMLHVPYEGDGKITQNMRDYVVKQLKEEVTACANIFESRPRPRTTSSGCSRAPSTGRARSTPISAGSSTSAPSSPPSAARTTPSNTTRSCARRSRADWRRAKVRSRRKAI
jgi:hypothetical protein